MSRFLDMKEFGEAACYLRLSNLEQLAARAQAFDGKHIRMYQAEHYDHSPDVGRDAGSAGLVNSSVHSFLQILDLIKIWRI